MTTLFNTESNNKSASYSIQDFQFRFRKLQLLCQRLDIEGILVICGNDSLNNEENEKLISWLFTGYSGNLVDKEIYLDPKFREAIFLFRQNEASCYLEPELFSQIERYIIAIPNINIFCPTTRQMENTDDVELHKIAQFYKMTRNLDSVGVALGQKDDNKITNIEKWPLLQAYALDEVGCGFFGMNHKARDITKHLNNLYEEYDKYSMLNLIRTSVKQMEHHLSSTFYIIDSTEMKRRPKITEQELNSIIRETFEFSIIKQPSVGNFPDLPQSRILFGKNSDRDFFYLPKDQSFLDCAASEQKAPLHFTLEYVDPVSRLRAARTYFTTLNETSRLYMRENKDEDDRLLSYQAEKVENPHFSDEKLLHGYYALIIRIVHSLLEHLAANIKDLNQEFVLERFLKEFCTPEGLNLSKDQLIVQLKCYNSYGVEVETNLYESSPDLVNQNLCLLRVQIRNIKSYINEENLGSVLFCDTFTIQSGAYHILTKGVPYFKCWAIDPSSSESIEKVKDVIVCEEFGKPVSPAFDSVNVYVPSTEIFQRSYIEHDIQKVHFTLHENGFKIQSEHWGNIAIFFKDLQKVDLLRKLNRPSAVLYFKDKPIMNSLSSNKFYIIFSGFATSEVFSKLDQIFTEKKVPFAIIDDIPEDLTTNTTLYFSGLFLERYFKVQRIQGSQILDSNTFMRFLEYQQQLKMNNHKELDFKTFYKLSQPMEHLSSQQKKIEVFLINGAYSAGKTVFAQKLAKQAKNLGFKAHLIIKNPIELPSVTNASFIDDVLRSLVNSPIQNGDKVLVVLPSILNTKYVVDKLLKTPQFTDHCDIRTIITKINVNTFYHNAHKEIAENFLTFCNSGYSQFIILDNYGTDDSEVDTLTAALRGLFTYSTIFRINSNIVQQSIAKDILSANNFDLPINKIERRRVIPSPAIEKKYVYIPFKIPLLKEKIHDYLYRYIFGTNNGYLFPEGKLTESPQKRDRVEDELVLLKERITRVNLELSKEIPYIYSVTGLVRIEGALDKVFRITVNSNNVLETPLTGVTGSLSRSEIKGYEKTDIKYENFDPNTLGLLFYGENLEEGKLRELMKNLVKPLKSKMKLKTREELTEDDIRELEIENRNWGLENGVFFDGSRFRNDEGIALEHHPKLEEIIQNHLEEENGKVGSMNRQIDKEWKIIEQVWEA